MPDILCVSIEGAIINTESDENRRLFASDRYLETPAIGGAIYTLLRLSRGRFRKRIRLLVTCPIGDEMKYGQWLAARQFYEETGISSDYVHVCRTQEEKRSFCKQVGVTHAVDHSLEALSHMETVSNRILFRPDLVEIERYKETEPYVHKFWSWIELEPVLEKGC